MLKLLNIIFPLITFSYLARIISTEGIGKIDFSLAVVQYFIIFAQVGIPTYGIRECSKYKNQKEKLSKTVQEILFINLLMIIISYFLFFLVINRISSFNEYSNLLLIFSLNIVFTSLNIDWFYQAIEEYKYIAIRGFIFKSITLLLVFILINNEEDYFIYAILTVLSVIFSSMYNILHSKKYINIFKIYKNYEIKRHIKPILILFSMSLAVSIYINLDKVMLGILSDDNSVGIYSAATKIVKAIIAIITSLGTVLLPRMSYYISKNNKLAINRIIKIALDIVLIISIPSAIGIFFLSDSIILLIGGTNFIEAIPTIKIISPIIILISLSNLIGIQILVSHGKEKKVLYATFVGASTNFILNLIFIPKFAQDGAAFSTVFAELIVTILVIMFSYSYLKNNMNYLNIFKYLAASLLIIIIINFIALFQLPSLLSMIVSIIFSAIGYFFILHVLKVKVLLEFEELLKRKIFRVNKNQ